MRVRYIAWWHGTLAVFVQDEESAKQIEDGLTELGRALETNVKAGDGVGPVLCTEQLQPGVSLVLAQGSWLGTENW